LVWYVIHHARNIVQVLLIHIVVTDPETIPVMPNPMRKLVPEGYDLYDVHLSTWFDDVSGNQSKQYNKHFVGYAANTNLPGQLLQQEFFVEYLSNSQHASSLEQLSAIKDLVWYVNA
jgi:hypothetical protein